MAGIASRQESKWQSDRSCVVRPLATSEGQKVLGGSRFCKKCWRRCFKMLVVLSGAGAASDMVDGRMHLVLV